MPKYIHFALTFITIFLLQSVSHAQNGKCTISGKVSDDKQVPVAYASVAIYKNSTPTAGVITDQEGKFILKTDRTDTECKLVVEFIGYSKFSQDITPDKATISLAPIILKEDAISLEGAMVSAKEVIRKSSVEHTTLNAGSNLAADKGTALDILRSASSVNISNDKISIRGNSNILVLLDGVPTTVSDLTTLPAATIKSIEVITNPDASHDASGTGGIINIISRKTSAKGFSGIVSANYGFNHFASANAAFTYNNKKASYRFSYSTRYEDDLITTSLDRHIKATGYSVFQEMQAIRYTYNNNISLGADFRPDPRNRLSVDIKCNIPRINLNQDLHNTCIENSIESEEFRFNDVTWNRENIEGSIAYTHIIRPEISEFSIIGSVSKIWGHRPSYYHIDGVMTKKSDSGGSPFISALQADYRHKFKAGAFSTGAKVTYRRNDIFHRFYELQDSDWKYSEVLSNDLLHSEVVPAAYAMFSSRIGKKFTYKAGIRGEFSTVTLESHHDAISKANPSFFLAPSLSGTYKITDRQELSLALSRRIGRPTYPQLNPYMSMVDATTYEQGNMHLKPERTTKLDLSYSISNAICNFFINGYVNHTADYISQITTIDANRLITTYVNAEDDLKSGIDMSVRFNPYKWFSLSLASNTYYVRTDGEHNGVELSNDGITSNSNIMLDFLPWKGSDIQCQYFVTTPQYFPQLTTSLTHQMNLGFKQKLNKGALTLSVLVTDIFRTAKWEVRTQNHIFDLLNISQNKSRMLWLGISYNFNSFKQKSAKKAENDRSLIKIGTL